MWNCDWEYENQETLRQWYEEKLAGIRPNYGLCGNRGYQKDLKQRRLEKRQNRVCKGCGKVFTPKRSDAVYCCNACRQRAYRQSVTDKASVQIEHLL